MGFHTGKHGKVYNDDKPILGPSEHNPGSHDGSSVFSREEIEDGDRYTKNIDDLSDDLADEVDQYSANLAKSSGITQIGIGLMSSAIISMRENIDLEVVNEDWQYTFKEKGEKGISDEVAKIKQRTTESAIYWLDKEFGYEESNQRPKNDAERSAQMLMEPFERMREEKLNYDSREADYARAKKIIYDTSDHVFNKMLKEIPRK